MIDAIVGTQWGDEGKGRFVEWLSSYYYDIIARYQGGPNAGHTIIYEGSQLILHNIPSGIVHERKLNVMGNGMVVDLEGFEKEMDGLKERGIGMVGRLFISPLIHLILPYHKAIDEKLNSGSGRDQVGSTGRGIGPAYVDKYDRCGLRIADLYNFSVFKDKFIRLLETKKKRWPDVDFSKIDKGALFGKYGEISTRIKPMLVDVPQWLDKHIKNGKTVLCEGAQATFLDIDFGTYPYVTSSHPISGGLTTGLGVSPRAVRNIWGVAKAYTTRVGNGPFLTELTGEAGDNLREWGKEYGATTGRPRRCGWFDAMMVKRAALLNGVNKLFITKLDVLGNLNEIKICYGYEGKMSFGEYPQFIEEMEQLQPRYTTMPGWKQDISGCRKRSELPKTAINYLEKIEELVDVPIAAVSVGPGREATIEL